MVPSADQPTAYVCEQYACRQPVREVRTELFCHWSILGEVSDMLELMAVVLFFRGGLILYGLLEWRIPYRPNTVSKPRRWLDNLGLSVTNGIL